MKYVTLPSPKNLFSLRRLTFASGGQWILAHVAYALPPLTREERAIRAKVLISTRFNTRQQVFLDFMLSQYVKVGVEELDREKWIVVYCHIGDRSVDACLALWDAGFRKVHSLTGGIDLWSEVIDPEIPKY